MANPALLLTTYYPDIGVRVRSGVDEFAIASGTPVLLDYPWGDAPWGSHPWALPRTLELESGDSVAISSSYVPIVSGSIAFRFKRMSDTGAEETILTCGVVGSGTDYFKLGIDSADHFYAEWNSNNGGANLVTSTGTIAADTNYTLRSGWDGTAINVGIDAAALDIGTRDAVGGDWSTGDMVLVASAGGFYVSNLALYDRGLNDNQWSEVRAAFADSSLTEGELWSVVEDGFIAARLTATKTLTAQLKAY